MKSLVSIIVPVYNGKKDIENCIEILLNQTYRPIEIIMVDDGSSDGSAELLDEMAREHDIVRVIHQKNSGVSSARNHGIRESRGEYIIFCDVDDIPDETEVEDNIALADRYSSDIVMFCFRYNILSENRIENKSVSKLFIGNREEFFRDMFSEVVEKEIINAPWAKLIKRDFLIDNNIFFEEGNPIYEDLLFATEIIKYMDRVIVNPCEYYTYMIFESGTALTKYYPDFIDSVSKSYVNQKEFCNNFPDNEEQLNIVKRRYQALVRTYLKQIVSIIDFSNDEKEDKILSVCNNSTVTEAFSDHKEPVSKKLIHSLIRNRDASAIRKFYSFTKALRG